MGEEVVLEELADKVVVAKVVGEVIEEDLDKAVLVDGHVVEHPKVTIDNVVEVVEEGRSPSPPRDMSLPGAASDDSSSS